MTIEELEDKLVNIETKIIKLGAINLSCARGNRRGIKKKRRAR